MGQYLNMMIDSSRRGRGLAEKLLVGIKPEQAARKPHFETPAAPQLIDTNHPTFCYGHLAIYPARMLKVAGLDSTAAACPPEWDNLFKAGSPCLDDKDGTIYPAFSTITAALFKNMDAAFAQLSTLDDKVLLNQMPDERYREFFPTVGIGLNFLLNNHVMMHLGQVSVWRRCFGLPSAM
ncbi:MAG TPA: hypothetical protein VD997_08095 [Phycisphaerales bacterium]|nr:hypothetical protein [Phycisphaerales bacterium]